MTIKEKFKERIARIKEYSRMVNQYREMLRAVDVAEQSITHYCDNKVDGVQACIKSYYTYMPVLSACEANDDVRWVDKHCKYFGEDGCKMPVGYTLCPYWKSNVNYQKQKMLLKQALVDKEKAFSRIF